MESINKLECTAVVIARHMDLPTCGIVKQEGEFWLFERLIIDLEDYQYLLHSIPASDALLLIRSIFPEGIDIDLLLELGVELTPELIGRGKDKRFVSQWNSFVLNVPYGQHPSLLTTMQINVATREIDLNHYKSVGYEVRMTFDVLSIKHIDVNKHRMLIPAILPSIVNRLYEDGVIDEPF